MCFVRYCAYKLTFTILKYQIVCVYVSEMRSEVFTVKEFLISQVDSRWTRESRLF